MVVGLDSMGAGLGGTGNAGGTGNTAGTSNTTGGTDNIAGTTPGGEETNDSICGRLQIE